MWCHGHWEREPCRGLGGVGELGSGGEFGGGTVRWFAGPCSRLGVVACPAWRLARPVTCPAWRLARCGGLPGLVAAPAMARSACRLATAGRSLAPLTCPPPRRPARLSGLLGPSARVGRARAGLSAGWGVDWAALGAAVGSCPDAAPGGSPGRGTVRRRTARAAESLAPPYRPCRRTARTARPCRRTVRAVRAAVPPYRRTVRAAVPAYHQHRRTAVPPAPPPEARAAYIGRGRAPGIRPSRRKGAHEHS